MVMRIVLDTIPLIYSRGADWRTTLNLYSSLLSLDVHNEYALLRIDRRRRGTAFSRLLEIRELPVHEIIAPVRLVKWAWDSLGWPKLEQFTGRADLYHVAGIIAPPTRAARVLVTIRGIVAEVIPELLPPDRARRMRKVAREAMRRADFYLAVSRTTQNDMVRYLGLSRESIFVVNHGVDPIFRLLPDRRSLRVRLERQFGIERPYILFVGAIGRHKNIGGILNAYRIMRSNGITSHDLWLAGPPDSAITEALEFIARQGLEHCVHLPGAIRPDSRDLVDLYNGASCFVFPSYYEGWCSPPVEAMACGAPVIASDRSSIPETVGPAALLANPDDHELMSQMMSSVLTDEGLRRDLVEKGFERASSLRWSDSASRLMEVYRRIEACG